MPRHPALPGSALQVAFLARVRQRIGNRTDVISFLDTDTHRLPPEGARLADLALDDTSFYRYGPARGDRALLEAIVEKLATKNGIRARIENVVVTAGATHALDCAARALLAPGDEILILSPHWPFIRNHVTASGAAIVEVPLPIALPPVAELTRLIESFVTPRTAAIYYASPSNPGGTVLTAEELAAIADIAVRNDLWIIADEVYEDFIFEGERRSMATAVPAVADRTLTVFSFSKSYAMAGLRIGYIHAAEAVATRILGLTWTSLFNVPLHLQKAALAALRGGAAYLDAVRTECQAARDLTVARLAPFGLQTPRAGFYAFLDLAPLARDGNASDLLDRIIDGGVLLAPGTVFGRDFDGWARLCYAAMPHDRLDAGLTKLAAILLDERR